MLAFDQACLQLEIWPGQEAMHSCCSKHTMNVGKKRAMLDACSMLLSTFASTMLLFDAVCVHGTRGGVGASPHMHIARTLGGGHVQRYSVHTAAPLHAVD